jgi:hypothetical protein
LCGQRRKQVASSKRRRESGASDLRCLVCHFSQF